MIAAFDTYSTMAFDDTGAADSCYGLNIVRERMTQLGKRYEQDAPTVLHSSYWPEQIFDLIRWLATHPGKSLLVGGNSPSTNPSLYHALRATVYHGDAEMYDDGCAHLSDGADETPEATIAVVPRVAPISGYVDSQKEGRSSKRYFCEISRGCKNRCFYCQYGWLKPYREANITDIAEALRFASTKTVRIFAADRFQHKHYSLINSLCSCFGITDSGSDLSVRFARKHGELFQHTRKCRFGIDGLSERVRAAVGKPTTDDDIIGAMENARAAGIKSFDWYMIYGFPGETEDDIAAFHALVDRVGKTMPGGTLAIHWNAFQPNAMTPLQWEKPATAARLAERQKRVCAVRYGCKVMHKPPASSPLRVAIRTMLARASAAHLPVVRTIAYRPSAARSVEQLTQALRSLGPDPLRSYDIGEPMPWDGVVSYQRDAMMRCARHYRRAMGIEQA